MKKILSLMLLIFSGITYSSDYTVAIKGETAYVLQDLDSEQIINLDNLSEEDKDADYDLFINQLKYISPGEVIRLPDDKEDDKEDEVYKYVVNIGKYRDDSHLKADKPEATYPVSSE